MSIPRWYEIANGELGTQELPGARHNPRILEYHALTSLRASDDETPWCASFVEFCLQQAGSHGTGSAAARSYLNWGRPLTRPTIGCVAVWQNHVGFFAGYASDGRILVLGGNQSNRVSIAPFSAKTLLGFRWPSGVDLPPDVQPLRESKVVQGTVASTGIGAATVVAYATEMADQLSRADGFMSTGTIIGMIAAGVIVAASVYALVSRIRSARP